MGYVPKKENRMKSDIVTITNAGEGIDAAMQEATACAVYRGLGKKETMHLRLLAEEMLGMARQITDNTEADFWVESQARNYQLHLLAYPLVTGNMRKELLSVATSGKNAAAKGVMGKIRDIIDRALAKQEVRDCPDYYAEGLTLPVEMYADPSQYAATMGVMMWSMNKYKVEAADKRTQNNGDAWDELEKSIVANIADEIEIAIKGDQVEMIVYKQFDEE